MVDPIFSTVRYKECAPHSTCAQIVAFRFIEPETELRSILNLHEYAGSGCAHLPISSAP